LDHQEATSSVDADGIRLNVEAPRLTGQRSARRKKESSPRRRGC
jgi:hypothetical protein